MSGRSAPSERRSIRDYDRGKTDLRATERLLEFIGEQTDEPKILDAVAEHGLRGDTLVRMTGLRLVAAAANRKRQHRSGDDTDCTGFEAALETAVGSRPSR